MTGISPHTTVSYDHPIHAELWPPHPDGPFMAVFHDRDIAFQPNFIERMFAGLPAGYETVSANQYIAFLHARIESIGNVGWQLKFSFGVPYCVYFGSHPSAWRVWFSDPWLEKLAALKSLSIPLDGRTLRTANASDLLCQTLTIDIPAGLGEHIWGLSLAR